MDQTSPRTGHAHLVGIAGAGMRSLGVVLEQAGWTISGSDAGSVAALPSTWRASQGHNAQNISAATQLVVHSPAIASDNVELVAARTMSVPVLSYPQMLGRLMAEKQTGVAIAGTHGKSTTVAMTASILRAAGIDPTVIVGAESIDGTPISCHGRSPIALVEACEYRNSFLELAPRIAAVLNLEHDHPDCFATLCDVEQAFAEFVRRVPADGVIVVPQRLRDLARNHAAARIVEVEPASEIVADRGCYRLTLAGVGRIELQVPGRHQIENACAAATIARQLDIPPAAIIAGLQSYPGLSRRMQVLHADERIALVDDYAHHPTAIRATLAAVRERFPGRRLTCVFEPHQACRVKSLLYELASSLQNADTLAVAPIFRAREAAWQPGDVAAADLAARCRGLGADVFDGHDYVAIKRWLTDAWQVDEGNGGVIVTLGAGTIGTFAHGIYEWIRENRAGQ